MHRLIALPKMANIVIGSPVLNITAKCVTDNDSENPITPILTWEEKQKRLKSISAETSRTHYRKRALYFSPVNIIYIYKPQ